MASTPSTTFNPSPEVADSILDAIADPHLCLADIAKSHSTTIESITLWMTREDIRDRLIATESAHAWRTRLTATAQLPKALAALSSILDDFQASRATDPGFAGSVPKPQDAPAPYPDSRPRTQDSGPAPHSPTSPSPNPLRLAILHHRRIETARKAAATILRLTQFQPLPYNAAAVPRAYGGGQPVSGTDISGGLPVRPTAFQPVRPIPSSTPAAPTAIAQPAVPLPTPTSDIPHPTSSALPTSPPRPVSNEEILAFLDSRDPTKEPTEEEIDTLLALCGAPEPITDQPATTTTAFARPGAPPSTTPASQRSPAHFTHAPASPRAP